MQKRHARPTRQFVLHGVTSSPFWSGTICAVGSKSRAAAPKSIERRVARNLAETGQRAP
jgi:hypothetical protein